MTEPEPATAGQSRVRQHAQWYVEQRTSLLIAALTLVSILAMTLALGMAHRISEDQIQVSTPGAKNYAYHYLRHPTARHYNGTNWSCLDKLWTKESGWNVGADNPTSSAYGIPQALPGSKMAKYGSDWRWNYKTQIAWGAHYIWGRYGNPCRAWAHSVRYNWY